MLGIVWRPDYLREWYDIGIGSQLTAASIGHLELDFPSLSRPLTIRMQAVSLAIQQVRLPKVGAPLSGRRHVSSYCTSSPGEVPAAADARACRPCAAAAAGA